MADAFSLQRDRDMRLELGAHAVLVHLRKAGYRLALLTNGASPLQRAKIERFSLTSRFHHIQIEGEVGFGKPDPAAFNKVFEVLAVDPAAVCMVGDSREWDIRPSRMLGCRTALYDPDAPTGDQADQVEADIVVRTLESLLIHFPGPRSRPDDNLIGAAILARPGSGPGVNRDWLRSRNETSDRPKKRRAVNCAALLSIRLRPSGGMRPAPQ